MQGRVGCIWIDEDGDAALRVCPFAGGQSSACPVAARACCASRRLALR